jgi:hypothetical protein
VALEDYLRLIEFIEVIGKHTKEIKKFKDRLSEKNILELIV